MEEKPKTFKESKEERHSTVVQPNGFRGYGKVQRLGKDETIGILIGTCYIQEKIDGANTSIWLGETGVEMGSRTRKLGVEEFNGFVPYIKAHEGIENLFVDHPSYRLYGEWLVRHTIAYNETAYKKWYMFDIWDGDKYLPFEEVAEIAAAYGITTVPFIEKIENPSEEYLKSLAGKTTLGEKGEGIVIKNMDFTNSFGDPCFAKVVTESFKEDNGVMFGGNNKHSDTYEEVAVVNKYITLARVEKVMNKIQPEVNERLDMKHIPRIMNTVYHDMVTEDMWEIVNKFHKLDFDVLQRIAYKKAKQIFCDVLTGDVSVADRKN